MTDDPLNIDWSKYDTPEWKAERKMLQDWAHGRLNEAKAELVAMRYRDNPELIHDHYGLLLTLASMRRRERGISDDAVADDLDEEIADMIHVTPWWLTTGRHLGVPPERVRTDTEIVDDFLADLEEVSEEDIAETALIMDFLLGRLEPAEAEACRNRLCTDEAFLKKNWPMLMVDAVFELQKAGRKASLDEVNEEIAKMLRVPGLKLIEWKPPK